MVINLQRKLPRYHKRALSVIGIDSFYDNDNVVISCNKERSWLWILKVVHTFINCLATYPLSRIPWLLNIMNTYLLNSTCTQVVCGCLQWVSHVSGCVILLLVLQKNGHTMPISTSTHQGVTQIITCVIAHFTTSLSNMIISKRSTWYLVIGLMPTYYRIKIACK